MLNTVVKKFFYASRFAFREPYTDLFYFLICKTDLPQQADSPSGLSSPAPSVTPTPPVVASPALPSAPAPVPMPTLESLPAHLKKPTPATLALVNQLVRKEFEKSLAQLEWPRGPAQPDLFFIPNSNHADFLLCVGLEDVVRSVQEHLASKQLQKEKQEKKQAADAAAKDPTTKEEGQQQAATATTQQHVIEIKYEYPNLCTQCSTDFTPTWRRDRNGLVLCERCFKALEKRQAKQEHAAKLKQLFVKASKDREMFEKEALAEQHKQVLVQEQERLERVERQRHQQLIAAQQAARAEQVRLEQQQRAEAAATRLIEQQRIEQLRALQQQQQQQVCYNNFYSNFLYSFFFCFAISSWQCVDLEKQVFFLKKIIFLS
jgi:hypothetical protein